MSVEEKNSCTNVKYMIWLKVRPEEEKEEEEEMNNNKNKTNKNICVRLI